MTTQKVNLKSQPSISENKQYKKIRIIQWTLRGDFLEKELGFKHLGQEEGKHAIAT